MGNKIISKEMTICINCIHAYVCEEYNLNRDILRKRCAYHNDHFLDIENSVVLTKEELNTLQSNFFDSGIKCGSKETAREIIERIKLNGTLGYGGYVIHDSTIEQICKKYGVHLGE